MDMQLLFESFRGMKAGVVGDVMLDTYLWGHVDRISPEAPVPVVSLQKREFRLGGAGNVALNLAALGAQTAIFSVTGDDEDGRQLSTMFERSGLNTGGLQLSADRITTNKMRVISRNQQMMRLDSEMTSDLGKGEEDRLIEILTKYIHEEGPHILIFEDYNKGVLTDRVIRTIVGVCREKNVVTAVDPKRRNFFSYSGVDIFKPNLKEVREGLHITDETVSKESLDKVHSALNAQLSHRISLITLSEKGAYFSDGINSRVVPSHFRNIADVSGAGDTVVAVASLVYAATKDIQLMGELANIAGGLVCEEVGTMPINRDRFLQECISLLG